MSDFELPTDKQLEQLREEGLSPYSPFLTSSFIAIVISLCLFFSFDKFISIFDELNSFDDIVSKSSLFLRFLLLPTLVCLISSLLFIFFQKRFYIKFSFLYPLFRKRLKFGLYYRFIFFLLRDLSLIAFILVFLFFAFYNIFPLFSEILMKDGEDGILIFLLALKSFLPIFILVELILLIVWFVIYKLLFLFSIVMNKNKVLTK